MLQKKLKLSILLLLGLGLTGLLAQEAILATGGDASGGGGSVSWSAGTVVFRTYTGINGSVAESVQQPYEISSITAIDEAKGINLSVSAYPNPSNHNLTLKIEEYGLSDLSFRLYDANGKLLQNKKITGSSTNIGMDNLAPATYFIKIIRGNREIKTFKIIKTQ